MSLLQKIQSSERPRERCLRFGAGVLSLNECLQVIIGTGRSGKGVVELVEEFLSRYSHSQWTDEQKERAFFQAGEKSFPLLSIASTLKGLGPAARARILCGWELGRRYHAYRAQMDLHRKHNGKSASETPEEPNEGRAPLRIPAQYRSASHEWLGMLPIFEKNRVGEFSVLEYGLRNHLIFDPREVFARILSLRPMGFYLVHNHPSGPLQASAQDLDLTRKFQGICNSLGLVFLGHWIVTETEEIMI